MGTLIIITLPIIMLAFVWIANNQTPEPPPEKLTKETLRTLATQRGWHTHEEENDTILTKGNMTIILPHSSAPPYGHLRVGNTTTYFQPTYLINL